jgi:predicted phosphodiesterase
MTNINENFFWTEEEKDLVFGLKAANPDFTSADIACILVRKGFQERSSAAIRGMLGRNKENPTFSDEETQDEDLFAIAPTLLEKKKVVDLREEAKNFFKKLKQIKEKIIKNSNYIYGHVGHPKDEASVKILAISDLHIPLHNGEVLTHALMNHGDADILVINGDFLDLYSVSQWTKNRSIPLIEEYKTGMKILRELASIFPKIYLTEGNHEDRLQRYFSSKIDLNVSFMTEADILHKLAKGYDFDEDGELVKMHDLKNVFYTRGQQSWYVQIGKCIFAHPTGSSGIPMRTAIKTAEWFVGRDINFEAVVCAHTHQIGSIIWNNKLLIEQGCSCIPMEYEATSKMNYRPQTTGYTVIMMDKNGHVDFESSRTTFFSTGSAIEPDGYLIDLGE